MLPAVDNTAVTVGQILIEIQTDNGTKFTNSLLIQKSNKQHEVYKLLTKCGISHHCIASDIPKHDGKVEWSHLIDMKLFYNYIKYNDIGL